MSKDAVKIFQKLSIYSGWKTESGIIFCQLTRLKLPNFR